METDKEIVFRFRFSRWQAQFVLAAFFIAWHPGFIGSEVLTLTTYYPAPYGGYISILTTNRTVLARDAVAGSNVGIGNVGAGGPLSKLDVRVPVGTVGGDGVQITDDNAAPDTRQYATLGVTRSGTSGDSYIGMTRAGQFPWGMGIANADNSFIVGQAAGRNVTTRALTLTRPNGLGESTVYLGTTRPVPDRMLYVPRDVRIGASGNGATGGLYGLCQRLPFGGGFSQCGVNEVVTAVYGNECQTGGSLLLNNSSNMMLASNWTPHMAQNCSGQMLCCRIFANN